jgi:hypothetical protein
VGITPLPRHGGVHFDPARPGHTLRISGHAETGIVVISIWRGDYCVITHELPAGDVPDVIRSLARALLPLVQPDQRAAS